MPIHGSFLLCHIQIKWPPSAACALHDHIYHILVLVESWRILDCIFVVASSHQDNRIFVGALCGGLFLTLDFVHCCCASDRFGSHELKDRLHGREVALRG